MHRFCDTDVFLQTENDAIIIYPLGGAVKKTPRKRKTSEKMDRHGEEGLRRKS